MPKYPRITLFGEVDEALAYRVKLRRREEILSEISCNHDFPFSNGNKKFRTWTEAYAFYKGQGPLMWSFQDQEFESSHDAFHAALVALGN